MTKNKQYGQLIATRLCQWAMIVCMALLLGSHATRAQLAGSDAAPGTACSPEDAVTMTANPGGNGGYVMTCLGGVWVATFETEPPLEDELWDDSRVANKAYVDNRVLYRGCERGGPPDCPNVGDTCNDGSKYAGIHPYLRVPLFMHPTITTTVQWSVEQVDTGADDKRDGSVNQAWVVANKTISDYPAFKICDDLNNTSALGHTDWYLPSLLEGFYITTLSNALNLTEGGGYHTSTEENTDDNEMVDRSGFGQSGSGLAKTRTENVICIRRN